MERHPYPSDLSDAQWALIEPLLPLARKGGAPRRIARREIVNALMYKVRTGCAWRMLPHDLPFWKTVYGYFADWTVSGLLDRIHQTLHEAVRGQAGRDPDPSLAIIDSQSVRTTQQGGLAA